MTDDLDGLLRATDPLRTDPARRAAAAAPSGDIREAIMSTPRSFLRRTTGRPVFGAAIAAALCVAAVVALAVVVLGRAADDPGGTVAARPGAAATDRSYYLIDAPGWEVTKVIEYATEDAAPSGEVHFAAGERTIQLFWRPVSAYQRFLDDRRSAAEETTATIDGAEAMVIREEGSSDHTAMWLTDQGPMELRGAFDNREDFVAIATTLTRVDEATWLAALPDSVVAPGEWAGVVEQMLGDVPLPDGVSATSIEAPRGAQSRDQVAAEVVNTVVCGWLSQWVAAIDAGDDTAAGEAVEAMSTSRQWAVLAEMGAPGAYPAAWEFADAIAGNGMVAGGSDMTVADAYPSTFGCQSPS